VRPRLRGFPAGFLAGLALTGMAWVWIVHLRFSYEIVVVADRTIRSVYAEDGPFSFVFPPSHAEIRPPSGPEGRLLLLGGFRTFLPSTAVLLRIGSGGPGEGRSEWVHLEMPHFARSCTAIVLVGAAGTQAGPCRVWRAR